MGVSLYLGFMAQTFCVLTGIYPPDTGGPSKFAETFAEFGARNGSLTNVITYTSFRNYELTSEFGAVYATSRKIPILLRYLRTIYLLNNQVNLGSIILANGCFVELALLRFFRKFKYIVKIPGDIVWERARNNSITSLDVLDFQTSKLSWKYRVFRNLFSYSIKAASLVLVPSTQLKTLAITWGARPAQTKIVFNSVQVSEEPISEELPTYDFVTVSRLVPWKGIEQVIETVCNQGYRLLVVGDGPQRIALEGVASNFPGLVDFVGEVAANKVPFMLKKARCFILNSSFEATSYALLEAMSLGLVPIANEGTGSQEVIQHGVNGFLCGQINRMDLLGAIKTVMHNSEATNLISLSARKTIQEKFNLEKNYELIMQSCIHAQ
jgi:glycosyltransferase involved in cell wall biosynthesis